MCLVALAFQTNAQYPVMIGANREESCVRPATPPYFDHGHMPSLWAGQDRGPMGTFPTPGTWLGVSLKGFAVAITNRDDGVLHGADKRKSRGRLVSEMLFQPSMASALEYCVHELCRGGFGGGNYLIADAKRAAVVHAPSGDNVTTEFLSPGLHVLTNLNINDPEDVRIQYVKANLKVDNFNESASSVLQSPEIIVNDEQWGTIASSIVLLGQNDSKFLHVDGKPQNSVYDCYSRHLSGFKIA